jgi:gliding motility-associated-like protein
MIKKRDSSFCKILAAIVIFCLGDLKIYGQSFQNGDLDGIIGASNTPIGWLQVPFGDPVSNATSSNQATSDLTGLTGPVASTGINGNPYSGNTFTSGLHSAFPPDGILFREGIMQNLVGLIPGVNYQIRFYQAVVKQENAMDPSGSWSVFADATLLGITAPTYSNQPFNSNSFPWELRTVIFQAINNTHLIKFLPTDDDPNIDLTLTPFSAEGVRMGIDSISLIMLQLPPQINIGSDTTICEGESLTLNVNCSGCSYLWQDGSTSSNYEVTQSGTYWVQATNSMGTDTDSIDVSFISPPSVNLGLDTILCNGQTLMLNAINSQASEYLWQDGSTESNYLVQESGTYWLEISNLGCSYTDTIIVDYIDLADIDFGQDTVLCEGQNLTLELSNLNATYLWQDNSINSNLSINQSGTYWAVVSLDNCTVSDTINITFVPVPNIFLGNDTTLCQGDTLNIDLSNLNATYLWQDNSINSSIEILQPGTYWVQVTQNTCLASDTINVNFNTIPNAPIVTSNSPLVCPGNLFVFEADSTTDGYFTWSGPSNFNSNNANNSFIAFPENQGVYEVNVMIDGCVSSSSYVNLSIINLSTIDDIDFPNVMTVNGDGVNDVLNVESYFQTCQEFKLSIFNRWGILVYEYSNGGSPFMGKSMNGEELKDGVYFYILSSKENIKNGYIHIIH